MYIDIPQNIPFIPPVSINFISHAQTMSSANRSLFDEAEEFILPQT